MKEMFPWYKEIVRAAEADSKRQLEIAFEKHGPPACTQGCKWCCKQRIPISPLEASFIYENIKPLNKQLIKKLKYVRRDRMRRAKGEWCPFLKLGRCSIYKYRPLICRVYYCFDKIKCRNGGQQPIAGQLIAVFYNQTIVEKIKETGHDIPNLVLLEDGLIRINENTPFREYKS